MKFCTFCGLPANIKKVVHEEDKAPKYIYICPLCENNRGIA